MQEQSRKLRSDMTSNRVGAGPRSGPARVRGELVATAVNSPPAIGSQMHAVRQGTTGSSLLLTCCGLASGR
jgi:hypothetical protein